MTCKKLCGFQRLVVPGKMVHTPNLGAFEFLQASYQCRYAPKGELIYENYLD